MRMLLLVMSMVTVPLAWAMEQGVMPEGATSRLWGLVTDEALTLGLLMAAGIFSGIALMGVVRRVKPKPLRANYRRDHGWEFNRDYDRWVLLMQRLATFGSMAWIFALCMIFLEGRYGVGPKIVVALTPSIIGGYLTPTVYNFCRAWLKRKAKEQGYEPAPGDDSDDVTRL